MLNRRNAFIGWVVLRLARRRLRRREGRRGMLRSLGRVFSLAAVTGVLALVARRFLGRGGSGTA